MYEEFQSPKKTLFMQHETENITLTFLNVAVGMLHPSFGNTDVRIQFFYASMQIDAARCIFHLVTSVI